MKLEAGKTLSDEMLIKLAPNWATHYRYNIGEVMFESQNKWMAIGFNLPFIKRGPYKQASKLTKCVKLPESKPFDISEYEFSDSIGVGTVQPDEKGDLVVNLNKGSWIYMDKQDAEAIAKHFKLI